MIWRAGGAIVLLATALVVARVQTPDAAPARAAVPTPVSTAPAQALTAAPHPAPQQTPAAASSDWPEADLAPPAPTPLPAQNVLDTSAIASLRATREGDPRAPEIGDAQPYERADANTLADPGRYQNWQASRREANYADYLRASQARLVEIEAHLAWGRQNGVSDVQLKAGEEKRDRLAAVREKLATDYPHLAEQVANETPAAEDEATN